VLSLGRDGIAVYLNGEAMGDGAFNATTGGTPAMSAMTNGSLVANRAPLIIGACPGRVGDASSVASLAAEDVMKDEFEGGITDVGLWSGNLPTAAIAALYAGGPGGLAPAAAAPAAASAGAEQMATGDVGPAVDAASDGAPAGVAGAPATSRAGPSEQASGNSATPTAANDPGAPPTGGAGTPAMATEMVERLLTPAADNPASAAGTTGNDLLVGTAERDVLRGGWGDDRLSGNDGDDVMAGGHGADLIDGGSNDNDAQVRERLERERLSQHRHARSARGQGRAADGMASGDADAGGGLSAGQGGGGRAGDEDGRPVPIRPPTTAGARGTAIRAN